MHDLAAVESIFFAALLRTSPEERAAYLDQACGSDQELRHRVERLGAVWQRRDLDGVGRGRECSPRAGERRWLVARSAQTRTALRLHA